MAQELCAGGTLQRRAPHGLRRVWLLAEMALLFVAAPLAMWWAVHRMGTPLFLALVPVLAVVVFILAADRTFSLKREAATGFGLATLLSILVVGLFGAGLMAAYVLDTRPASFLEFPANRPETWARIMLIYPFASVLAQEIVYRTFFFHRYGALFGDRRELGIGANALLFGFGHIVIGQPAAIIATIFTGWLFARRYAGTRSYWAVAIEHTLWGWMVFTIGLGRYFFTGVSNV